MPFNIIRADITKVRADAVVNAANTSLLGGGGVDGAIHKAAGKKLLKECKTLGGCETGKAKITKGYNMRCKYIIHAVGPVWRGGGNNEERLLYSCYKNSLELAIRHKCKSVAFPLISAGAYGFPKDKAMEIAKQAFTDFLQTNDIDITLVIFDKETVKLSIKYAEDIQSFIDDNYSEEHYPSEYEKLTAIMNSAPTAPYDPKHQTGKIMSVMPSFPNMSSLEQRLEKQDISFSEKLLKMIDERGMKDADVYKAANISKQVFSKIRSAKKYHPKKITVLAFAIALRLTLSETDDLLEAAGYTLTRSDKLDIVVAYFIEKGRYKIYDINEVLFKYDLPLLGSN